MSGPGSLTILAGGGITLTGSNSFSGGITANGALTLTGANSFAGQTTVNGTLNLDNANALQNSTLAIFGGGQIPGFQPSTGTFIIGGLAGSRSFPLSDTTGSAITFEVGNNNSDTTYSGILFGPGSLTKTGTGTLSLTGSDSYAGNTTVNGGTLSMTNDLIHNGSNNVFIAAGTGFGLASFVRAVPIAGSYAGFGSTVISGATGFTGTSADIRAGESRANHNLTMQWRFHNAGDGPGLLSDVLNLTGMSAATGAHVQSDPFDLQMTYNPAALNGAKVVLRPSD